MTTQAKKEIKTIATRSLGPETDTEVMALYRALAGIFRHPWRFKLVHHIDGLPSIHIEVHPPYDDPLMYDERVFASVKELVPTGYFFDGTSLVCKPREDGSGERDYFIYPRKSPY